MENGAEDDFHESTILPEYSMRNPASYHAYTAKELLRAVECMYAVANDVRGIWWEAVRVEGISPTCSAIPPYIRSPY